MKRIVCFFVSALFATCALAQAPYPSKPIRLVLPLAVGSATDLIGLIPVETSLKIAAHSAGKKTELKLNPQLAPLATTPSTLQG